MGTLETGKKSIVRTNRMSERLPPALLINLLHEMSIISAVVFFNVRKAFIATLEPPNFEETP